MNPMSASNSACLSRLILIAGLLLALTACGFHLRGTVQLPPQMAVTYVDAKKAGTPLLTDVRKALSNAGAQFTTTRSEATAVLHIIGEDSGRRVLSVGSSGRVSEFELFLGVEFRVLNTQGEELLEPKLIELRRGFQFDENDVLGKEREEEEEVENLRQQAVRLILLRIEALNRR